MAGSAALGAFAVKSVQLASDLQEVQNVVDTVFKNNAEAVNKFAKDAISQFGLSELSAKKFAGTIGAMLSSANVADNDILKMSTSITGLAADFASFYNLSHEEAFNKIRAGLSGETEPLKQLGIDMSVASLNAFALQKRMKKTYEEMSQAEKIQLRYNYLMQAGANASGDFAKTLDSSLANQLKVAKEEILSIGTEIATKFLPSITEGVKWIRENIDALIALGAVAGTALIAIKGFFIIDKLVKTYAAWKAAITGATVAQTGLNVALAANPIGATIMAVYALIAAFTVLYATSEDFRKFIDGIGEDIANFTKSLFDAGVKMVENILKGIFTAIEYVAYAIQDFFGSIFGGIADLFKFDLRSTVKYQVPYANYRKPQGAGNVNINVNARDIQSVADMARIADNAQRYGRMG